MEKPINVIISGGGTGGHIFPAVSIANALKKNYPAVNILFVGAEGRMEMQRVPQAGYDIIGLPIAGFDRKKLWKNLIVIYKILRSQIKAYKIIKKFMPDIAVGVGGYASGPTLKMAGLMGIPTLLQEQNSYAGVTNKLLAKNAKKICVAYSGMDRFFSKDKIVLTGNPVRQNLLDNVVDVAAARKKMGLDLDKETILILGGSLGARSINECMLAGLDLIKGSGVQFIWQTGKIYFDRIKSALNQHEEVPNLIVTDFINDMAAAYSAADLIISRAGAGSISEFCLLHKPVVLVPSPNVAEDHQTKNALALVEKNAAIYVKDAEVNNLLLSTAIKTVRDKEQLLSLSNNIAKLALPNSADKIAEEVYNLANKYRLSHEH